MNTQRIVSNIVAILVILAAAAFLIYRAVTPRAQSTPFTTSTTTSTTTPASFDPKNATYIIEDQKITLVEGKSEIDVQDGEILHITTGYLGEGAQTDLNGDGKLDSVFYIVQNGGGTGYFYYVFAVLTSPKGYTLTNGVIIGDRIDPQSITIDPTTHILHVTYLEHGSTQAMAENPDTKATKNLQVTSDGRLTEVK